MNNISTLEGMKKDNTIVSFKYKPNLETSYTADFTNVSPYQNTQFILDVERRKVRGAYERSPVSFATAYRDTFSEKIGSKLVGDPRYPNLFDTPKKT